MKQTNLNRPTTFFERAIPWLFFGMLIVMGCGLGVLGIFKYIQTLAEPRNILFVLIVALGTATVVLIVFTFFYSLRKRLLQEWVPGTMMAWLQSHVYLGLLSFVIVFVHIWMPSFSQDWSTGKSALVVFALLVISGAAWRIVYTAIPPRVARDVGNLSTTDTKDKIQKVRIEIDKALAGKSAEFRQAAQNRLGSLSSAKVAGELRLPPADQADWLNFIKLSDRLKRYTHREVQQETYARFLQSWRKIHLPLTIILMVLIGVHVWDTLRITNVLVGGKVHGLPPAEACANCHSDIVDEWRLAMHSQAQTGPVVVAQTNLALKKFPEFGRACNNCHAPIGTALTGSSTLPQDVKNILRIRPNGSVMDDGVTCVVCHTLAEAPEERRGMFDNFPVVQGTANHFADMFGPPLGDVPPLPNSRHNSSVKFMTDNVASSQLCGACHNVKVDIDGDGQVTAFPGSEGNNQDTDGDGQLDENELEFDQDGKALSDLVLQTTYDEWQDYVSAQRAKGGAVMGCVDCHMPLQIPEPIVNSAPGSLFGDSTPRPTHLHSFIGVDYNLSPGYYEQPGMAPDARQVVQDDRAALLRSAVGLSIHTSEPANNNISTVVTVDSNLVGHSFPTGFAFARQMWLEVSAQTTSGKEVCLAGIEVNGQFIKAKCASGHLDSPQADLVTCDPLALAELGLKASKNNQLVQLNPDSIEPLSNCDPWLTNFQKILTDGDPDGDGIFTEEPYQSLLGDIVKTRVRTSDQQAMDALNPTLIVNGQPKRSATFEYIFDVSGLQGENVVVTVTMHFRHLPPYLLRALDGGYPDGLTAADLLQNLVVVDMATVKSTPVNIP